MKQLVEAVAKVELRPNKKWKVTLVSVGNREKLLWSEHYNRKVDAVYACRWFHPTLVQIVLVEPKPDGKRVARIVSRAELGLP